MSLWNKPIDQITFQDVDAFCRVGQEEGPRLDYKSDWPTDLAKTMAAFANTVGGLILLGIDADQTNNKPIWPSQPLGPQQKGLPMSVGLSERVHQVARDAIFPPVLPEVSLVCPSGHPRS